MSKSLPPVSAKVIADAEQFINEFKRADNAARRSSANIDKEVGTLTKKIGDKFRLADFGKDVLKGAGLFGGFDIARTASEAIVSYWKEAAELAKEIEASTARQLANTLAMIKEKRSPEEQVAFLSRDIASSEQARIAVSGKADRMILTESGGEIPLFTGENAKQANALTESIQKMTAERDKLVASIVATSRAEETERLARAQDQTQSDQDRKIKALAAGLDAQEKAFATTIQQQAKATDATAKLREETDKLVESIRDATNPARAYERELAKIAELASDGRFTPDEAAAHRRAAAGRFYSGRPDNSGVSTMGQDTTAVFDQIEERSLEIERIVGRAADGMADAWVDSLKGVEGAWSNLGDAIITEILRIAAQILIVKPLINGLGGMIGSTGALGALGAAFSAYGGGKASGGGVEGGYTYRVNENGQEFFKPNVGGTIIPVGASGGMGGGGGGDTFAFHYNFSSGIQRQDILPILSVWQRETLGKIADAKRRRSSLGAALA